MNAEEFLGLHQEPPGLCRPGDQLLPPGIRPRRHQHLPGFSRHLRHRHEPFRAEDPVPSAQRTGRRARRKGFLPEPENIWRSSRTSACRFFRWRTRSRLQDFDLIGFSLPSELNFTNVLQVLEMSGLPLLSAQRREGDPLDGGRAGSPWPIPNPCAHSSIFSRSATAKPFSRT